MSTAMITIQRTTIRGIIITALCLTGSSAQAAPRGTDLFSATPQTQSSGIGQTQAVGTAPLSMTSAKSPALVWFEKFDALRQKYRASDSDKVILVRPLMQEAERVQQWIETAKKIANNYSTLAKSLKNLPTPAGMNDIKEYRNLTADWYEDAASVYVDLIKPRPAAKTIEELQDSVNVVKKKSESLSSTIADLKSMDLALRRNYKVHLAMQDDSLQKYVKSK
jgi:uncharacterized protein YukE